MLLILVLAASAVVGVYAALLSFRHEPLAPAEPFQGMPQLLPIETLPPLPRIPQVEPAAARAAMEWERATATVEVVVRDVPSGGAADSLGVAVLSGRTGAPLAWIPLSTAPGDTTRRLRIDDIPEGDHLAVIADGSDSARSGYRSRASLRVTAAGSGCSLSAGLTAITVQVDLGGAAALYRLARTDDPGWHLPQPRLQLTQSPALLTTDGKLELQLGAGAYALSPADSDAWRPVEFTVPGPAEIRAEFRRL